MKALNCIISWHKWNNALLFSKNGFPQHSCERKARKIIGNWLSLVSFLTICAFVPERRHTDYWFPCVSHLFRNPINP